MRTTTRAAAATAGLATAVLLLAGCGSSDSSTAASPPASSTSMSSSSSGSASSDPAMKSMIMIKNFAFTSPSSVKAGSTVTVMNEDSESHTVTADSSGGFDVTVPAGATKTFTAPAKAGSYAYHCNFHSNMHGTLRVR